MPKNLDFLAFSEKLSTNFPADDTVFRMRRFTGIYPVDNIN